MTRAADPADIVNLHASCVTLNGRGLLIIGPSGSGKSALALQLMAFGAKLVADDRTDVIRRDGGLIVRSPSILSGLIEARGVGILHAETVAEASLVLIVDLGREESERLPQHRSLAILGVTIDLVLGSRSNHFPAALLCYLTGGRQD